MIVAAKPTRLIAACLLLLALVGGPARGETPAEATRLYQQGALAYRLGHFAQALARFRAALKLTERPSLLFNIAQCHRQLGERRQAIFYYRLYLSESERLQPGAAVPFAAEVLGHLRRLEEAPPLTRPALARPALSRSALVTTPPTAPPQSSTRTPPLYRRWWFWTLIGAAVVGATTGTIVALQPRRVAVPSGSLTPGQLQLELRR